MRLQHYVTALAVAAGIFLPAMAQIGAQIADDSLISPSLTDAQLVEFATADPYFAAAATAMAQGRICAYAEAAETEFGREVVTSVRTSRVYIPPRATALIDATASARLYLDYTAALAGGKVRFPESWDEVGFLVLERASSVLHHYFLAVEYRNGLEKELAQLRAHARRLWAHLARVPSLEERLPDLVARSGVLWFERCEEILPLYQNLFGIPAFASAREALFLRPNGVPLITAWAWDERKRSETVQRKLIENLQKSSKTAVRLDGLLLEAALAHGDRPFATAYTNFVEAVQSSDARAAYADFARELVEDRRFRSISEQTRESLRGLYHARFVANRATNPEPSPKVEDPVASKGDNARISNLPRAKAAVGWQALATPGDRLFWETMPLIEARAMAAGGDVVANYYLFLKLRESEAGLAEAERALAFASRAGLPQAQVDLAKRLTDSEEKFALTAQASATMYPAAQLALGELLIAGEGTPRDAERGLALVRAAYDLKVPEAEVTLAQLYASGIGQPRNPAETPANLFLNAAKSDLPGAMFEMHLRYLEGYNSPRDQLEASRWLVNAAIHHREHLARYVDEAGNARPQLAAELDQFAGRLATYTQAVIHKKPDAMKQVAEWYESGSIGRKSTIRAYALFTLAHDSGVASLEEIVRLKTVLTTQELKTAEMLAAQWKQIRPDVL